MHVLPPCVRPCHQKHLGGQTVGPRAAVKVPYAIDTKYSIFICL